MMTQKRRSHLLTNITTCMARTKETKSKKASVKNSKKKQPPAVVEIEEKEEEIDILSPKGKAKKPVEIDAADILPEVDEKIDEETVALSLEDEESEDVASLDAEDLNPFGDKWEE